MNFLEVVHQFPNVLSEEQCTSLINKFEGPSNSDWSGEDLFIFDAIKAPMQKYTTMLSTDFDYLNTNIMDTGYRIFKRDSNSRSGIQSDFKIKTIVDAIYHTARGASSYVVRESIATYIIFLNKTVGGRIIIHIGNEKHYIEPEVGKLVMFPAYPFYKYSEDNLIEGPKYFVHGYTTSDRVAAWCV